VPKFNSIDENGPGSIGFNAILKDLLVVGVVWFVIEKDSSYGGLEFLR
jgi:hypothetical protein